MAYQPPAALAQAPLAQSAGTGFQEVYTVLHQTCMTQDYLDRLIISRFSVSTTKIRWPSCKCTSMVSRLQVVLSCRWTSSTWRWCKRCINHANTASADCCYTDTSFPRATKIRFAGARSTSTLTCTGGSLTRSSTSR
jgi:hypothetical protein